MKIVDIRLYSTSIGIDLDNGVYIYVSRMQVAEDFYYYYSSRRSTRERINTGFIISKSNSNISLINNAIAGYKNHISKKGSEIL